MNHQIKSNYHTHTYLCKHAEGTPSDYIALAIKNNYHTIGITDHGPLIDQILSQFYTRRMTFSQYHELYLPQLQKAVDDYPSIRVLKGLEIEYFYEMDDIYPKFLKDLDYLVLGQHYFHHQNQYYNVYQPANESTIDDYVVDVIKGIKSGYFKILAHPDIFTWNYPQWDAKCEEAAYKIIKCAMDNKIVLEINANGIRNSRSKNHYSYSDDQHISYSYPKYEFWKIAKKMNASVMINDDVHWFKEFNDDATKEAYELAEELGLEIIDHLLK